MGGGRKVFVIVWASYYNCFGISSIYNETNARKLAWKSENGMIINKRGEK
jgi:hypothetical protein